MATLHVQLDVRGYDLWREAFGRDAGGRQKSRVRRYRTLRRRAAAWYVLFD